MRRILYVGATAPTLPPPENSVWIPCLVLEVSSVLPTMPYIHEVLTLWERYTHILFTSKNAIAPFCAALEWYGKKMRHDLSILSIGPSTTYHLENKGIHVTATATMATQEGLIALLDSLALEEAFLLFPRSSLARPHLRAYCDERGISYRLLDLYTVHPRHGASLPPLADFDALFFASPSSMHAFLFLFGAFPEGKELLTIGPITQRAFEKTLALKEF